MALEAAYCNLDATKVEYAEAKQKAREVRERDENLAPESQKKAKDPEDKTDNLASDVTTNAAALEAAKKACEYAGSEACCHNSRREAVQTICKPSH